MKIKVEELKNILANLKAGLTGQSETTEQSSCFVFTANKIYTYNDDIAITSSFNIDIEGAVSAKELIDIANKLKGDEIEITTEENEIRLKCGRSKAGIKFQSDITMPIDEIKTLPVKSKKWKKLTKDFKSCLKSCLFSASKDMSSAIITVIHCIGDMIESTDNDRATICYLEKEVFKTELLLPAEAGKTLVTYKDITAYDDSQEGWIHFLVNEGVIFSCRIMVLEKEENYPDLAPHFDIEGSTMSFPSNTGDILDKAGVFIDVDFDQDSYVEISITTKGSMKIRAEGDSGWFEETTRIKGYKGNDVSFIINPQYLLQILTKVNTATIGEDRVLFETEDFKHIVTIDNEE